MNIVTISDAPIEKKSKLIPLQIQEGFTQSLLDFSMFCSESLLENYEEHREELQQDIRYSVVYEPKKLADISRLLLTQCKETGMTHTIAKAPTLMEGTRRQDLVGVVQNLTMESIKISVLAGCQYIIIDPVLKKGIEKAKWKDHIAFYTSFIELAKEKKIMILIRNQYKNLNGHFIRCEFSDAYKLKKIVDELNEKAGVKCFGICMDTGVCNICGQNQKEFIVEADDYLKAVIVRENDSIHDNSLLPFSNMNDGNAVVNCENLIKGLRTIAFDGELIFDFRNSLLGRTHLLRQEMLRFAKKTIDYMVWQISMEKTIARYGKRVMFGAGNMFHNYMKFYGKKYLPEFTCDNNSKLWGTEVEGVEVKNPKELLNIPQDYVIFICNMYYKEIAKQLRTLGIQNQIEYYNDEYLPYSDIDE